MAKISEIMEERCYTCNKNATVKDVIRFLAEAQIGGISIVDDEHRLVGYIRDIEIMRFIAHNKPRVIDWGGELMPVVIDEEPLEEKVKHLLGTPVMEIASKKKWHADVDDEIEDVAEMFKNEKLQKVAVLKDGKVVGAVGRSAIIYHIITNYVPELPEGESA
jgi:predicted transcriptional regulator